MTTSQALQTNEVAVRLHEIAYRDTATKVTVAAEDLRQLLAAASQAGVPTPSPECDAAFADHYKADPNDPSCAGDLAVWRSGWSASRRAGPVETEHHIQVLGQALGECIVAAGIVRPDVELTGPELLMFANDLRTHLAHLEQGEVSFNAVIRYVLDNPCESPMEFLRCWNEGNFDTLRKEWPEAPEEIYIGADTLHPKTIGFGKAAPEVIQPLTSIRLLTKCRDSLADGLESPCEGEAVFSIDDRALIAELDAYLAGQPSPVDAAGAASGVRDDLDVDGAQAQYKASAQALIRAVERQYPVSATLEVQIGSHIIQGEVTQHRNCWWSSPGEFIIRNIQTGKTRKVTHSNVKDARAALAKTEEASAQGKDWIPGAGVVSETWPDNPDGQD